MNVGSFQLFFQKNNKYIWVEVTVCIMKMYESMRN